MSIVYLHDHRYSEDGGKTLSAGQFSYDYWKPFVDAFDRLRIVGRTKDVADQRDAASLNISNGKGVSFDLFPSLTDIGSRLRHYRAVSASIRNIIAICDGVVIRSGSEFGWIGYKHARALNKPVGLEVVGCSWDSTWNHGRLTGRLYAPLRYRRDRRMAAEAQFVSYVTASFLQRRYPASGYSAAISDVQIEPTPSEVLAKRLASISAERTSEPTTIGLIGCLDNKIKGVSDAIQAVRILADDQQSRYQLKHLGPGDPTQYRTQAERLGIGKLVRFDGVRKSGRDVLDWLDSIDLYLQPSYQEGLPRAVIEAMSRGCPVIGSTVGGIPELVSADWLHAPGDSRELARLIKKMLHRKANQSHAAQKNFDLAKRYTMDKLLPKRVRFWSDFSDYCKSRFGSA